MLAANERDIILKSSGTLAKLVYVIKIVWEYEDKNGSNFQGFFSIVIFQYLDTVAVVNFNAIFPIYLNSLCPFFSSELVAVTKYYQMLFIHTLNHV